MNKIANRVGKEKNMPFVSLRASGALKRAAGSLCLLIGTMALLEFGLWFVSIRSKAVRQLVSNGLVEPLVPDPVLGVRLNPDVADHDEAGFRNLSVVESPYLVALGDSQTYGTGLHREDAWPQQFAALTGKTVYNMGVGAYGPVQELILLNHAMTLHPQWVVEAFYSGNDLYDAYNMVYTRKQIVDLRSSDPNVISAIDKAETESPLERTVEKVIQECLGNFNYRVRTSDSRSIFDLPRHFLSEHSRLWGLLRAARHLRREKSVRTVSPDVLWGEQVSLARRSRGGWIPFEKGRVRTILVPQYRLTVLKMEDPRIREGLRVSIKAIRRMSSITQKSGVHFMVALMPTKELVFFDAFGDGASGALAPVAELARQEQMMWTEVKNELRLSGISYVEMLPALRDSLAADKSPYPESFDGHPNSQGHKVIAAAAWRAITASRQ